MVHCGEAVLRPAISHGPGEDLAGTHVVQAKKRLMKRSPKELDWGVAVHRVGATAFHACLQSHVEFHIATKLILAAGIGQFRQSHGIVRASIGALRTVKISNRNCSCCAPTDESA